MAIQLAVDELQQYVKEMIAEHRQTLNDDSDHHDLFSALLESSEQDNEGDKLTTPELIGDIFIFLVAGHETTAHSLAFALGLLALEQEEQEKLYQHIKEVIPDGEVPVCYL